MNDTVTTTTYAISFLEMYIIFDNACCRHAAGVRNANVTAEFLQRYFTAKTNYLYYSSDCVCTMGIIILLSSRERFFKINVVWRQDRSTDFRRQRLISHDDITQCVVSVCHPK